MKTIIAIFFLLCPFITNAQLLSFFNSYPTDSNIPSINLNDAYAALDSYCIIEGNATVTNDESVTERGIFIGNSPGVTYATRLFKIADVAGGNGTFTVSENIIDRNSTYYVKGYAIYSSIVVESDNYVIVDTDLDISASHGSITNTTATINLILNNPNNYYFTDRYVLVTGSGYAATITAGAGTTSVDLPVTGLTANTTYTYTCKTISPYCGEMSAASVTFTTLSESCVAPTLTTAYITNITTTTASGGGNITSDGGCAVTARGVCWNTTGSPTISDSHTTDGTGTGSFTSNFTELTCGVTYYVKAYATNSTGTFYGSEASFTTTSLNYPQFELFYYAAWLDGSVDLTNTTDEYAAAQILVDILTNYEVTTSYANVARSESMVVGSYIYYLATPCVVQLQGTYRVVLISGIYRIIHINSSGIIDLVE